ncbi:MAG: sigma-70 family RNA polymerase sigma factor [Bacteroides sp.]|nr:sigma-70 family RNA polymerase sigma factor [Bacteroides sp.]
MIVDKSEKELLQLLKAGSTDGFGEICRRYTRRLYAYCQRYTRCELDLEELVQDILMDLWTYRSHIDVEKELGPLLLTIAKRRCVDMIRSTLNSPIYEYFVDTHNTIADESVNAVEYEEYVEKVRLLIAKLPLSQRRVVELSRFQYLSNSEISSLLGISEKTVRNRLSLGLKTLRKYLDNTITVIVYLLPLTVIS